jgi:Flp pilus assembly protein TadD
LKGAIAEFRKAADLDPNLSEGRANLAQALQKAGSKDESRQVSEDLRKRNAEASKLGQAMLLVQTSAGHSNKGEFAEAVRTLQEAVSLSPNLTEAQYQLALALRQAGDTTKSEEVFGQVLQMDPGHARAHLNLGLLLVERRDPTAAKAELEKAALLMPSLVEAHAALGKLAEASQDWPSAVREFQAVLAWNPQDRVTHYNLGQALKASGLAEAAARELQLAQETPSEPPSSR